MGSYQVLLESEAGHRLRKIGNSRSADNARIKLAKGVPSGVREPFPKFNVLL